MKITLNGNTYQIDSWRGKDVVDFAPRASVPGGSVIHSELGLYQPIVQDDWQHGFGFEWYQNEAAYMRTEGRLDTRHNDAVILWSAGTTDTVATASAVEGFVNFNGEVYAWGAGGLYRYTGGSWSNVYSANAVNWAVATGTYLFYAPDGARIRKVNTSNTHSDAGVDSNATDFGWFEIHSGYIYAGKDDSNVVHFDSTEDLSDLHGDTSGDTAEIYVGMNGIDTIRAKSWAGKLYVAKSDGLYQVADDNQTARRVLEFQQSSANFRFLVDYNGKLAFPVRSRIYVWNGSTTNDITPRWISKEWPYKFYTKFDNAVVVDRWLFVTAQTVESSYEQHILAWDGVGWHKLAEPVTNGNDEITSMGVDMENDRLWYHIDASSDVTKYVDLHEYLEFATHNFPTSGTHSLITSRIAGGFRWVKKSMISLTVGAANVTSNRYIDVYYRTDGVGSGGWTNWGKITSNGQTLLEDPGGNDSTEFDYIQFRFDFVTDTAAQTPILEDWTAKVLLRPDEAYGYTFDIPIRSQAVHGYDESTLTAKEMLDNLKTARASKSPVELVTPYEDTIKGYVTAINEDAVEHHPDPQTGKPDIEGNVRVSFIEVPELS